MYGFLQTFHSYWAIWTLLLLILAVVFSIIGFRANKEFLPKDKKIPLFALIATHTQLLVALVLYFISPYGFASFGLMKDATLRLTSLEHPLTNIIAVALITVGWSKHKKAIESKTKYKNIAVFYGLGLLLILSRIPWQIWLK